MTAEIADLHRIEKLLQSAERDLANFDNCPADCIISSVNAACDRIESARDILAKLLEAEE